MQLSVLVWTRYVKINISDVGWQWLAETDHATNIGDLDHSGCARGTNLMESSTLDSLAMRTVVGYAR